MQPLVCSKSGCSEDTADSWIVQRRIQECLELGGGGNYSKTTGVLGVRITPQVKGKSMGLSPGNLLNYKCKMVKFEPILKLKQ